MPGLTIKEVVCVLSMLVGSKRRKGSQQTASLSVCMQYMRSGHDIHSSEGRPASTLQVTQRGEGGGG